MQPQAMSPEFTRLRKVLADFVENQCIPAEAVFLEQLGQGPQRWEKEPEIIEKLKKRARSLGLWNLFLPKQYTKSGAQLTTYEYGMLSEIMGRSILGPVATNCAAPDTGNMEVLLHYGTEEQKNKWLYPLLDSKIRSAFAMTEPAVASSDATNINTHIRKVGNEWVINGEKWWISNAGHPDCKVFFVLGVTSPDHPDIHRRHSVVIVPAGTPGFTIGRPMTIYGYDDAPHGHCEVSFKDVRVPLENIILGEGRGFEVIQGRLGPGRIHHCMKALGMAERALELMVARVQERKTFGRQLASHGVVLDNIARSRIKLEAARLLVLNAAAKMDQVGPKAAKKEIGIAKVAVPNIALDIVDKAVQMFGAAGVSQDTPLAYFWGALRTLRLADGPDEIHIRQIAKQEIADQNRKAKL